MIIKAGYINKSSVRFHTVFNLIIKPFGWKTIFLRSESNDITKICNNNTVLNFDMKLHDSNQFVLLVNDIQYHSKNGLFEYEIEIDIDESKYKINDVVTFIQDTFYDS